MPLIIDPPFRTSDSGLVLYAPLWAGELSGSSFNSRDIYKHLCTVTGALWTPQGRTFGGNDKITIGSLITSGNWTIKMWVSSLVQDSVVHFLCPFADANANDGLWFGGTNVAFANKWGIYDATTILTSNQAVVSGTWYQITVSKIGITYSMYLNNIAAGSGNMTDCPLDIFKLGNRKGEDSGFKGTIGEALVYSQTLELVEIQQNFLATKWRYV